MNRPVKTVLVLLLFLLAGSLFGRLFQLYWPDIKHLLADSPALYHTENSELQATFNQTEVTHLGWRDLLPEKEETYLSKYQSNNTPSELSQVQTGTVQALTDQLLLSIQASSDEDYKSALHSTNIVKGVLGKAISISGFIVPIEVNDDRTLQSFFVVPYFGACIHFPPPPPNQIIFVQLPDGFAYHNLADAFTLTGILEQGMFEDPLGTSAYQLKVTNIVAYHGQPDDFRAH
ncbi:DUF3299 domain-containing protein [Alteromonas sp. 1_MG-2023]|uniref:DUF3299 domain-containing protein n=1 Tax=Alteromonas sp. 1_MG-2023 TaxID=3062669 RepID=UPI0026E2FEEE|nr:DUF3299 domain-containing protein [Alteromonas sp. 1_MG-2023]MDO6566982.1 DUF3299 domain-containing protein [Alteromonas sp. 1_MG-2023]